MDYAHQINRTYLRDSNGGSTAEKLPSPDRPGTNRRLYMKMLTAGIDAIPGPLRIRLFA
jgi:hypothetical protein